MLTSHYWQTVVDLTFIAGIQFNIDYLSHAITVDSNITIVDTSWSHSSRSGATKFNSLTLTELNNRSNSTREWQSISIREVPVSTMETLSCTTTCGQVSVVVNNVATTSEIIPHLTDVHIGMVSQSLAHE